ncbi:hypothetical protein [Halobacillus salinus]|uniref:Uncharacterized protein n=1 Tax=Halobacillus salinus TaxID=192814 RepID=A0A4Z0GV36_9BACI|nr:hypothetical protein [Halobacillus salinus]TGB01087.1 hypothetical protein E4663_18220 [Halobacillus salinus]
MTKRALKILLPIQAKSTGWFIGIYALIVTILITIFTATNTEETLSFWMSDSIRYTINIYLLIMGIVYPLTSTKLYVSQGLTRKQFFWAYTGAMSIISLFLLIPIIVSFSYFGNSVSLLTVLTEYLYMPLYFLTGWICAVGFQLKKWYTSILGLISALAIFNGITIVTEAFNLSESAVFALVVALLAAVLLILPRVISRIPLKS